MKKDKRHFDEETYKYVSSRIKKAKWYHLDKVITARGFIKLFVDDNPEFKVLKFIEDCGIDFERYGAFFVDKYNKTGW